MDYENIVKSMLKLKVAKFKYQDLEVEFHPLAFNLDIVVEPVDQEKVQKTLEQQAEEILFHSAN